MSELLGALGDFVLWLQWLTPVAPLAALPVLVAAWIAARHAMQRGGTSRALALARTWAAMLALSCVLALVAWLVSRAMGEHGARWPWFAAPALFTAAFVPPARALRCTLLRLVGRPGDGGGRDAEALRAAAWLVFAAVMLVCAHALAMKLVFPYAGGEFHAMFAYSDGSVYAARWAWRFSVAILGVAAVVFGSGWIPLPWWTMALLACGVGLKHWWQVVAWPWGVSPRFHQLAVALFVALPPTVLLIAAAGAWIRRAVARRRDVARTSGTG